MIKKAILHATGEELIVVKETSRNIYCVRPNDYFKIPQILKYWQVDVI